MEVMKKVFVVTALIGVPDKFQTVAHGVFNNKEEATDFVFAEYSLCNIATEENKMAVRQQFDTYLDMPEEYDTWSPMFGGTGLRMHIKPVMI